MSEQDIKDEITLIEYKIHQDLEWVVKRECVIEKEVI